MVEALDELWARNSGKVTQPPAPNAQRMACIDVQLPSPLAEFVLDHAVHCVPECCGIEAFDFDGPIQFLEYDPDLLLAQIAECRTAWSGNQKYYVEQLNWGMHTGELHGFLGDLEEAIRSFQTS